MTDIPGLPYDGVTDVVDESGNGKGVALNVWPSDNRIPIANDPVPLDSFVLAEAELAYAHDSQRLRVGDGYTPGGDEVAYTSDFYELRDIFYQIRDAIMDAMNGKANLAGGNAFTGDQTVEGMITATEMIHSEQYVLVGLTSYLAKGDATHTGDFYLASSDEGLWFEILGDATALSINSSQKMLFKINSVEKAALTNLGLNVSGSVIGTSLAANTSTTAAEINMRSAVGNLELKTVEATGVVVGYITSMDNTNAVYKELRLRGSTITLYNGHADLIATVSATGIDIPVGKVYSIGGVPIGSGGGGAAVSDAVYGVAWDGDTTTAPSKNAVYDKIQALTVGGGATLADGDYGDVLVSGVGTVMTAQSAAGAFNAVGPVSSPGYIAGIASYLYSGDVTYTGELFLGNNDESVYIDVTGAAGSGIVFNSSHKMHHAIDSVEILTVGINSVDIHSAGGLVIEGGPFDYGYLGLNGADNSIGFMDGTGTEKAVIFGGGSLLGEIRARCDKLAVGPITGTYAPWATIDAAGITTLAVNLVGPTGLTISDGTTLAGRIYSTGPWIGHSADAMSWSNQSGSITFGTVSEAAWAFNLPISVNGAIATQGAAAGINITARDFSNNFILYANADALNFYSGGANRATLDATGFDIPAGTTYKVNGVPIGGGGGGTVSDTAYSAAWNGVVDVAPSKNALYDKFETLISDAVYGAGWNAVTTVAPSQNAVYDKIEAVIASIVAPSTVVSDVAYAASWNGVGGIAPSKNAVYDQFVALAATIPAAPSTVISDVAFAASWDAVTTIAPSKNAVYDKFNTLGTASVKNMAVGTVAPGSPAVNDLWVDTN